MADRACAGLAIGHTTPGGKMNAFSRCASFGMFSN